ncbi:MAG TPA: ATP synthase F1 subunit gamma [Chthoniobacteraceae bacterium]|jgi:F-type H+-transporting ATPase subunit gamma
MAANTRDIRRRIKSIKNTAQITKAMQMVAASKMRRAQAAALAGRPYAAQLNKVLESLSSIVSGEDASHPLLRKRTEGKELVLLVSTDKGLCGALNTNLLREAAKFDPANTVFVAAGRKGMQYLVRNKRDVAAEFELKDNFTFLDSKAASKFCMERFLSGAFAKVTVLFTNFVNTLTQTPRSQTILPVSELKASIEVPKSVAAAAEAQAPAADLGAAATEYLFEPNALAVLDAILPHYVHFQVYQMILDSRASEHSARMVAMKSATDNAKQLIKDLTLEYNKVRQASITTELLEISTAQMALG